ncbi:hypothetical protein NDU88_002224 [Pleurodeles waltl]|uniref:Uncharacterized protein n=1 Tax=Pleurodeles waltl TaxID=8319 RepID=A0AAV7T257_PLEWA|nr:hypothetical protein NDU88_002224 [Pleurodeles waltl]
MLVGGEPTQVRGPCIVKGTLSESVKSSQSRKHRMRVSGDVRVRQPGSARVKGSQTWKVKKDSDSSPTKPTIVESNIIKKKKLTDVVKKKSASGGAMPHDQDVIDIPAPKFDVSLKRIRVRKYEP